MVIKTAKLRASSQRQGESFSVVLSLNEAVAVVKSHFWLTIFAHNTDIEGICSLIDTNGYTMSPWFGADAVYTFGQVNCIRLYSTVS